MHPKQRAASARRAAAPDTSADPPAVARWRVPMRLAYVAVVLVATLTKLRIDPASAVELGAAVQESLRPHLGPRDVADGLRNVLLFAGWGLVWCMTAPSRRAWRSVVAATVTGLLLSTFVEGVQLFSPRRQASIVDVFTNTVGALAGGLTTVVLVQAAAARRSARSYVGMPMFVFAVAYGVAALLEIVLPGMRQELLPAARGGPLDRLAFALSVVEWRVGALPPLLLQFLLMLPAGGFLTATLAEHGRSLRVAWVVAAVSGAAASIVLEVARGLVGQPIEPDMAAVHMLGLGTGARLTALALPMLTQRLRGRERPIALAAAYTLVLLLWRWRPFRPELNPSVWLENLSRGHLFPLDAIAMKVDLFSASIVGVGFLLHLPIGALLAVWPLRTTGLLRHVLPGLLLVAAVETGQILVAERFFDTTDIIIGAAGVLAGWGLLRKAGFRTHGEALPTRST